ncbi:MAG: cobalt-precorrin 5A hydrolase [Methanobacteriaceae archaeon]
MKVAIISVTENGKELGKHIESSLSKDLTVTNVSLFHKNVKKAIEYCFNRYNFIIGIMSTGILIRSSCNLLNSKKSDPGIIAIDEKGNHVISLVSGHIGGANNFSKKIASLINGTEVITTASDVNGKIAIDTLSEMLYWDIEDTNLILNYNKAIINNRKLIISSNTNNINNNINNTINNNINNNTHNIDYLNEYLADLDNNYSNYYYINSESRGRFQVKNSKLSELTLEINVLNNESINSNNEDDTDINRNNRNNINIINNNGSYIDNTFKTMKILPKNISIGIGSRKGINKENIIIAINKACENLNIPQERINRIATGEMKKGEPAIIEIANDMNVPLDIISINDLKSFFNNLNKNKTPNTNNTNKNLYNEFDSSTNYSYSNFVMSKFGIPGLCEGVAMISAKNNSHNSISPKAKLIHRKLAINGVTVAIAVSD